MSREVIMNDARMPIGRWERAKQDKRERSMAAAREVFAVEPHV
jgi:hypothetical protein